MESESKKKLRSPFKFTLTTSALTPKKGGNSEVKVQGPQLLQPKSSLDYSDKPGNARVARTESENKPRFSMLSSLRNNTLGAHTKSESKLSNLDHTNHIEVKENGRDALNAEVKWRERGIDVGDQASPVYDRPRSQIYTSTPLSSVVTDDVEYDTPRSRSFVSDGELNTKNGNEQMSAVVSQLETPPQSPKEKRKGMVMMVSKSLFHSYNSNEKDDIISSNCDTRDRYNMNTTDTGNSMHQKSDQHSDAILQKKQSLRLDTGTSGTAAIVPTECNLSAQPVAPPRKHSNARTPTRTMSSPLSSPSNHDADVTTSPRVPSRRRRLTRKISLGAKKLDDDEFIGFASLPEQVHRKAVKRGFEFSLMVVGETGLGKSTLINSLFLTDLYKDRELPSAEESVERTVEIEKKQLEIEERGVKVRLSVVDTPGFNDAVNGDEHWQSITDYVDRQFDQYYQAESGVNRKNIQDTRVHCCLYFISPYGHGLKPLDVFIMKKLHNKVNIVPLIAKSDILTPKEVKQLKTTVLEEIQKHSINIYQFPECDSDEDEEFKQQDKALKSAIPFAVVGSNTVVEVAGKKIRGRMYPWGIVEVDNPKHCDFGKLRQMLISTHMQDLKDITSDVHYENYRAEHIAQEKNKSQRARTKLKRDSIANLEDVNTTETLLAQKEAEIERMQAMLTKMQAQLQNSPRSPMNGN